MKHIKNFEKFYQPSIDELKNYEIKKDDYVIANGEFFKSVSRPFFINDLIVNEIAKVKTVYISNKGYNNEDVYCELEYTNIPEDISKYIYNKPSNYTTSVQMEKLRIAIKKEVEKYKLKQNVNKYNL